MSQPAPTPIPLRQACIKGRAPLSSWPSEALAHKVDAEVDPEDCRHLHRLSNAPLDAGAAWQVWRLLSPWASIVADLPDLGPALTSTANAHACLARSGPMPTLSPPSAFGEGLGLARADETTLRLYFARWAHGFAIQHTLADGAIQRSVAFFDLHGSRTHSLHLGPSPDERAFQRLLARHARPGTRHRHAENAPLLAPHPQPMPERPDHTVDLPAFHRAWASMRSAHGLSTLVQAFGLSRLQALRLAPPGYVQRLAHSSVHEAVAHAAQLGVPLVVTVGNRGAAHTHVGLLPNVVMQGSRVHAEGPHTQLSLDEAAIASVWLVRHPTAEGLQHTLESFDANGELITLLSGSRQAGHARLCAWQQILSGLWTEPAPLPA